MSNLPLAGVRVIDMSWLLPGPFCTGILADLGADVVKVEPPSGDYYQDVVPGTYAVINAGKIRRRLDLKSGEGRAELSRLIAQADVLIEGFRPGVMARLGFDFPKVRAINPAIIYASISGYGQSGPLSDRPGHDVNYMAQAGALSIPDTIGKPSARGGLPVGDLSAGLYTAVNIIAALRAKAAGQAEACHIDMSITEAILHMAQVRYADYLSDTAGGRNWHHLLGGNGVFKTSDGVGLALGIVEPKFWNSFWSICGQPPGTETGLSEAERRERIEAEIAARDSAFWEERMTAADLPFTRVLDPAEALSSPLFAERGMIHQVAGPEGRKIPAVALPGKMVPAGRRDSSAF